MRYLLCVLLISLGFLGSLRAEKRPDYDSVTRRLLGIDPTDLPFDEENNVVLETIQNRKFYLNHEFTLSSGLLPVDPYYKGVVGTFAYTLHPSLYWAWEIASLSFVYNISTDLRDKLEQVALASGTEFIQVRSTRWVASSRLVVKPLYGKQAFVNASLIHLEAFLCAGPALVGRHVPESTLGFGLDAAGGLRVWLSERWSLRADVGDLVWVESSSDGTSIRQALHLALGVSASLGGGN